MYDYVFETDNKFEIPLLKRELQVGAIALPFEKWGYIGRGKYMPGTYHFYTDDYKFDAVWKKPDKLLESQCSGTVEVNFSTNDQMPLSEGLYRIYKKRWLSRYWQLHNIPICVDLFVSDKFVQLNLLGVPKCWKAYCTRAISHNGIGFIERDYSIACNHAETDNILFVVYGGGRLIKEHCQQKGYLHILENCRRVDNG